MTTPTGSGKDALDQLSRDQLTPGQQFILGSLSRSLRNWCLLIGVVLGLLILVVGYGNDRVSCERQVAPRQTIDAFIRIDAAFQDAMGRFDGPEARLVTFTDPTTGRQVRLSRPELRAWVADRWNALASSLPAPDCSSVPPPS